MTEDTVYTTRSNPYGRVFNVRLVRKGERYGPLRGLVHDDDDPLVVFRDTTDDPELSFDRLSQTIATYYRKTLLQRDFRAGHAMGLLLCGSSKEWMVDADTMGDVTHWLVQTLIEDVDVLMAQGGAS